MVKIAEKVDRHERDINRLRYGQRVIWWLIVAIIASLGFVAALVVIVLELIGLL